jgi:hypothetical protein
MKSIVIGAAVFAAFTSLAHADEVMGNARESFAQMPQHFAAKSSDVIVDGRVVGRDPSVSVRMSIANEANSVTAAGAEGGGAGGDAGGAAAAD